MIRAASQSCVKVNLRSGRIMHTPPPLVFEGAEKAAAAASSEMSIANSMLKISEEYGPVAAWRRNEQYDSDSIKAGWRRLMDLERQEEEQLLIELDERLGLA